MSAYVEMRPVISSNVARIGYDQARLELHVEFKHGGGYVYHGVLPEEHAGLMAAESIGSHLAKRFKGSRPVTKKG